MRGKLQGGLRAVQRADRASMRPAHCAREVVERLGHPSQSIFASMRPAHCAREVLSFCLRYPSTITCFNEARALCAGSSVFEAVKRLVPLASMRPAHCAREVLGHHLFAGRVQRASMRPAHCAREVPVRQGRGDPHRAASMRPAHCAREVGGGGLRQKPAHRASMRPAHCAREVPVLDEAGSKVSSSFNEARALCAGSSGC